MPICPIKAPKCPDHSKYHSNGQSSHPAPPRSGESPENDNKQQINRPSTILSLILYFPQNRKKRPGSPWPAQSRTVWCIYGYITMIQSSGSHIWMYLQWFGALDCIIACIYNGLETRKQYLRVYTHSFEL